jgi:rubredoxin
VNDIYYPAKGNAEGGIAPERHPKSCPMTGQCPLCGTGKEAFKKYNNPEG